MNWLMLTTEEQLVEIDLLSQNNDAAVLIFKHSTRCAISSVALNRFENSWKPAEKQVAIYFLDLLKYRSISDQISKKYNIPHESPQALLIKNGKCIYSNSHSGISAADVLSALS